MGVVLGTLRPRTPAGLASPGLPVRGNRAAPDRGPPRAVAAASRMFGSQPAQVAQVRRFIGGVLAGYARAGDVVLCVSEFASNAILHSDSRRPGGQFIVRAGISRSGRIRAEVEDLGGPWEPGGDEDEERGRGLLIVDALASRWGISGSSAGRLAWLEMDPP